MLLFIFISTLVGVQAQNVGIGTHNPAKKLEVENGKVLTSGVNGGGADSGFQMHANNGTDNVYFQIMPHPNTNSLVMQRLDGTPGSETYDGNVLAINQSDAGILLGYDAGGSDRCDPSAVVQIWSDDGNKGVLLPIVQLTGSTDMSTITSPATGLMVFVPSSAGDLSEGYHYFNGTVWKGIGEDSDWKKTDGSTSETLSDDIYTDGNVGLGTTAVSEGTLNIQSDNQDGYGYTSHVVYEDADGTDPLNVVYSSKTVNTSALGTWYNTNIGARISVVNFCMMAHPGTTGDAIAGSFNTSWNKAINHHISVAERIQGGTVTESANVITVDFNPGSSSLGTDLILEIRVNSGNNFIEVRQVGGSYSGDIKMAFHVTRFFD